MEAFSAGRSFVPDHPPHPTAEAFERILEEHGAELRTARTAWLALCLSRLALRADAHAVLGQDGSWPPATRLADWYPWVARDPEHAFGVLDGLDRVMREQGRACIFALDGLDRTATRWPSLELLVGGALSLALDLARRAHRVRLKVFLRPDLESAAAKAFPDASKLRGYRESLEWTSSDLYRLVIKRLLAVDPTLEPAIGRILGGDALRNHAVLGWTPAPSAPADLDSRLMSSWVGPYMGANKQKGRSHSWLPTHLGDASRAVSPRSFLVAFARAADLTQEGHDRVLAVPAIHEGVVDASRQRVEELAEDFPWIDEVQRRLRGLLVPCEKDEAIERLRACDFSELAGDRLGPRRSDAGGLLAQLLELKVFLEQPDARLNVPDLYRVAMGIRRKGGIPPPRAA